MAYPSYIELYERGALREKIEAARQMLKACGLCPRLCRVNRLSGELGYCRSGALGKVASWNVHRWEEPPISGSRGSGTIFFSNCTARCLFCQNYPISQLGVGQEVTEHRLAGMMLELQSRGCHNINLVTPTHYVPQLLAALEVAVPRGLRLPLLYNTSGYDAPETLQLLEGVVDIYLPDAKYADDAVASRLSGYRDYVTHNRAALLEMFRQVGYELILDPDGIALRGMIVRHLVLPQGLSQTPDVLRWVAMHLSPRIHVSLMAQYFPAHRAVGEPDLGRPISVDEYAAALEAFDQVGLENGWKQQLGCEEE
jgi:putative pyruvate formate lyase activating enzyme